jgi:tetraacyldisaccharide 4'-kinase
MKTPDFWRYRFSVRGFLLTPLGMLYAAATRHRLEQTQPYLAAVPVISVGNVTAGGAGKTPVAIAIARRLAASGIEAHILSRGYGGRLSGPVRVDPGQHDATETGDEPLLLATHAPTWVGRDRELSAKAAAVAGAQALILDDGLQNAALLHSLSLLVIDGGFGFGNRRLIPAGPLREPIVRAAERVQGAIIIGKDKTNAAAFLPATLPVFRAAMKPHPSRPLKGRRVVAFAGIGRPEKFRDTLHECGVRLAGWFAYPDHYVYREKDFKLLAAAAKRTRALLVTTEKDFVRLPEFFRAQVELVKIELEFEDENAFLGLLEHAFYP